MTQAHRAVGAVVLLGCLLPAGMAQEGQPVEPVYRFDMSRLTTLDLNDPRQARAVWDTVHLVAALQGLANRDRERLLVRYVLPWDDYWFEKLTAEGWWLHGRPVVTIEGLDDLLARFRNAYEGVVLYDERVPATSNVASTIAGCEDLLPVRYDTALDSLYNRVVRGGPRLPVKRSLFAADGGPLFTGAGMLPSSDTPSTGSAKCDAYLWAKEQYLDTGACDPARMGCYIDQHWLQRPTRAGPLAHCLSNHDYVIAHRGFFFDLHPWDDEVPNDDPRQPVGADRRTLEAILLSAYRQRADQRFLHVAGFVPWAWKYCTNGGPSKHEAVPSEWKFAEVISNYNGYMDADALGSCGFANASFYRHMPLEAKYPQQRPTEEDMRRAGHLTEDGLVQPGKYILVYLGDYDAAAWLNAEFPSRWDDAARGSVPMAWAINPNLADRMAPALVYARRTATANDFFIAGDSGAGYVNPGSLQEPRAISGLPSGVEAWARHCRPYFDRWDLSITGFIIDGYAPGLSDEGLEGYARFSPDGIVAQKVPQQGRHGEMPFVRMRADLAGSPEDAGRRIEQDFTAQRYQWLVYRTILHAPRWHRDLRTYLLRNYPEALVHYVDPYTFFATLKRYEGNKQAHRPPPWPDIVVRYEAGAEPYGLQPVFHEDGPYSVVEVAGRQALRSPSRDKMIYLYFALDDGFCHEETVPLEFGVTYLDRGRGRFALECDNVNGPYGSARWQELADSGEWRTATFNVRDGFFGNRQNSGADFRLINDRNELAVAAVVVRRAGE